MVEGESLGRGDNRSEKAESRAAYDYFKQIARIARSNGWDIRCLGLVSKDLPGNPADLLSKKEFHERNILVKSILKRFGTLLTPPVPLDLEASIRGKSADKWLPWEREAIEKVDAWRMETHRIKLDLLMELHAISARRA
ncbi:MAG: hypothetical protein LDL33_04085 [Desulfomonile sp.]|nr:hypothetical protein [Desulfomonile sp.]